jgi:hypothetical protein
MYDVLFSLRLVINHTLNICNILVKCFVLSETRPFSQLKTNGHFGGTCFMLVPFLCLFLDPENWGDIFLKRRLTCNEVCGLIVLHNQRFEGLRSYNMLVNYEQKYIKFDLLILKIKSTGACISRITKSTCFDVLTCCS